MGWQGVVWFSGIVGQVVQTYMTGFWKFSSSWLGGWWAAFEDTPQDLQSVGLQGVVWLDGMVGQVVET